MTIYFKNLKVKLHVLYILKTHVNRMLYTIRPIMLFIYLFLYNFRLQKLEISTFD